ncbi:beta-glucosidase [Breznakibacter xylanolyticus]|uniref:Beta-glucosidase n=2 Tax=Breznakibacter xylanolyticus TaxID=990 RepID=A0A2W7N8J2_9BACT|nr:beta-glucosidase [Breznakibacter xylanolyticus]
MLGYCLVLTVSAQHVYPFQNRDLPVEERINNLLSLMTLDEKVSALSTNPSVPRLGVKGCGHIEGLHGVAMGGPAGWGRKEAPVTTTQFPQAYGLGATWNPALIEKIAALQAYEARYLFQSPKYRQGALVVRAPNADLGRDPRWGRTEECYGEDPFLTGTLAAAFSKGLQGNDPRYWITASLLKHFLANSNEDRRDSSSSDFDERLWREYYAMPFYKAITHGGANCYMAAYNAINGTPATVHPMLRDITMREWGVNGIICTDGGAYRMLINSHHAFSDLNSAAAACVKAGINQFLDDYREGVYGALANGLLFVDDIDAVLRGNYRVMIRLGLLDDPRMVPYASIGVKDSIDPWTLPAHRELAREVTRQSVVLLKNDKGLLPLQQGKVKSVAMIGLLADTVMLDWYSGTPPYTVTPYAGMASRLPGKVALARDNDYNRAVDLARASEVAIVCVGNNPTGNGGWKECPLPSDGKEAVDRKSLTLEQEQLIRQVLEVNPNTVVVLISSFPYAINWTVQNVPAIVHLTHSSQELGNALADVLWGDVSPGGKLTQTWPASIDHLPEMMDYDIRKGRTYQYVRHKPLFPFGYGLSYTKFKWSDMAFSQRLIAAGDSVEVSLRLTNTGSMSGDEVVQLYATFPDSKVDRPVKKLVGFARVSLAQGESRQVRIPLSAFELMVWDVSRQAFVLESGKISLTLGASSDDVKLTRWLTAR